MDVGKLICQEIFWNLMSRENMQVIIWYMQIGYMPKDPFKPYGLLTGKERNGNRVGFEEDTFLYL